MGIDPEVLATCLENVRKTAAKLVRRVPPWVTYEDLVGAGNLGLAEAIRSFERHGSQGNFITYASFRIRGQMSDSLRLLDPLTRDQRRESRRYDDTKHQLEGQHGKPPTEAELADELKVSLSMLRRKVAEFDMGGAGHVIHFEAEGEHDVPLSDALSPEASLIESERQKRLLGALSELPKRLRFIAEQSLEGRNLKEIGAVLGLTESRMSQLRAEAVAMLHAAVTRSDPHPLTETVVDQHPLP